MAAAEIRDWVAANTFLRKGRDKTKRKIAHETWVEAGTLTPNPDGSYAYVGLRHYSTTILVWVSEGVVINSHVCTNTTIARMRKFLPAGVTVFRRDNQLCYRWWDMEEGSWEAPYERPVLFSTRPPLVCNAKYLGQVGNFFHAPVVTDDLQIFLRELPPVRRTKKK